MFLRGLAIRLYGHIIARDVGHLPPPREVALVIADSDLIESAARRKLQDYERRRRQQVKFHADPAQGRVSELDRERQFGRIESDNGRSIYFHRNSLLGFPFDELAVGSAVRFVEEAGDLGPQASTVRIV